LISNQKLIVAYDPGNHCGISWRNPDGTLDAVMIYEDWPATLKFIKERPKLVVYEDFQTAGNIDKHGLYTVRLIGAIEAMCLEFQVPCTVQIPQARYAFRNEAAAYLKSLRGKRRYVVHEMDATAHLLAYEQRAKNDMRRAALVSNRGAVSSRSVSKGSLQPTTSPKAIVSRLRNNSNLY
jgi:hypothetical protein